MYLKNVSDITTAFEDFSEMYNDVMDQETLMHDKLDVTVMFDDSAVDEIISQAIRKGQKAGTLAFQIGKRLEYGLNLVKDRSGIKTFTVDDKAISDMETFINNLLKKYYRQKSSLKEEDLDST